LWLSLYVLLQWSFIIMLLIHSLFRLHLGLACIYGVFFSRIYVADSRRVSAPAYFGKRGVTIFFLDQSTQVLCASELWINMRFEILGYPNSVFIFIFEHRWVGQEKKFAGTFLISVELCYWPGLMGMCNQQ